MTMTSPLAAHGGTRVLDLPQPHYQWPAVTGELEDAVRVQLHRSLSDRDASGVIGEFESAFARFVGAAPRRVVRLRHVGYPRHEPHRRTTTR